MKYTYERKSFPFSIFEVFISYVQLFNSQIIKSFEKSSIKENILRGSKLHKLKYYQTNVFFKLELSTCTPTVHFKLQEDICPKYADSFSTYSMPHEQHQQ